MGSIPNFHQQTNTRDQVSDMRSFIYLLFCVYLKRKKKNKQIQTQTHINGNKYKYTPDLILIGVGYMDLIL